jgi:hypothetical protein
MYGPTCIFWANLTPSSLNGPGAEAGLGWGARDRTSAREISKCWTVGCGRNRTLDASADAPFRILAARSPVSLPSAVSCKGPDSGLAVPSAASCSRSMLQFWGAALPGPETADFVC